MHVVLKNALENLILTEKRKCTTSITFFECFLKRYLKQSMAVIGFAIFTKNALYVFKILSILFAIPATSD